MTCNNKHHNNNISTFNSNWLSLYTDVYSAKTHYVRTIPQLSLPIMNGLQHNHTCLYHAPSRPCVLVYAWKKGLYSDRTKLSAKLKSKTCWSLRFIGAQSNTCKKKKLLFSYLFKPSRLPGKFENFFLSKDIYFIRKQKIEF